MCLSLAAIALIALCDVVSTRHDSRIVARHSRNQSKAMHELLRSVRMAETIAGIGVWQYEYATGVQQWSDGLKRLFGIEHDAPMCEGDAETLLCASDVDLVGEMRQHASELGPFTLQFNFNRFNGEPRRIVVQACNLRHVDGKVQRVVAVVRDVSEEQGCKDEVLCEWDTSPEHSPPSLEARTAFNSQVPTDIDTLTGLPNRRRIMRELDQLVMDARLSHRPLVLVMFDIDHFKNYVELHGREEGDRLLQKISWLCDEQASELDVIGRVGGAEFAWIIPNSTERMALEVAERLRQSIARVSEVEKAAPVTINLGIAAIQPGDTTLSLFERADTALCEAKHSGCSPATVAA